MYSNVCACHEICQGRKKHSSDIHDRKHKQTCQSFFFSLMFKALISSNDLSKGGDSFVMRMRSMNINYD